MTDEAELLQRLRNREKNSIDEAIRIYTPYLSTVLYHMAGNSLPKEDIELSDGKNFIEENFHNNYVWETVMSLGEPDSEIFVRRYKFDEKIKDISKAMGLNISTVKTRLSRGKRKLRKMLSNAEERLREEKICLKNWEYKNRQILPAMLLILIQRISDREFMQNLISQIQKGSKRL